ncbi:MAG TPA: Gfo/Idh/MocA family oxidoreductase, partial [Gemmatimonadaceae bacterium]|nr:Gfo/Idh/MocA family oxidoreductase [Gemmatimonadaceae bacterium]
MSDGATTPVRIALVGCGRISRNHFEAIAKIDELQLVAVCDAVEARAREAGVREDVPWFTSYSRMLEHAPCDVVAVCTPSGLHPQHGMLAARAG